MAYKRIEPSNQTEAKMVAHLQLAYDRLKDDRDSGVAWNELLIFADCVAGKHFAVRAGEVIILQEV